jgi:tRNA-specific 2-thiouridylase
MRGADSEKDQAYFLWGLPPTLLPLLHFPLGSLTKPEVRARARTLGLVTAEKPESQEICFVPAGNYRDLLDRRLPPRHPALQPGDLVTSSGEVVGRHEGYAGYTVGQRKGLGGGFVEPFFVLEIRPETREVVVGPREELYSRGMGVEELNWLTQEMPVPGEEIEVQIRHRARAVPGVVAESAAGLEVHFRDPQRAVTPGQSAAIFRGERLLGGGRIARALSPDAVSV